MAQPIAIAEEVSRVYHVGREDVYAVRHANWQILPGRLIALQGRSGSGKTTLLNLVGGLDRPTSGMIRIMENDTRGMSDRELTMLRRHKIGFIFQAFALLPVLSAYENVELPMRIAGMGGRKRHERALDLLDLVGLSKRASHRPFELSGGEQGRVAIARALANQPALLLADEPTGDLDSVTGLQMMLPLLPHCAAGGRHRCHGYPRPIGARHCRRDVYYERRRPLALASVTRRTQRKHQHAHAPSRGPAMGTSGRADSHAALVRLVAGSPDPNPALGSYLDCNCPH